MNYFKLSGLTQVEKHKIVIAVIKTFIFFSLFVFQSCSSTLETNVLKHVNRKLGNSRNEQSVFIKEYRKKLYAHFLKDPMPDKKYYIVEFYSVEHSFKIMVSAILVDDNVSYYVYNSKTDAVEKTDFMPLGDKAFYEEVFEMAKKKEYDILKGLYLEESRRLSHSSPCYLIELKFNENSFDVEKNIGFRSFGVRR